MDERAPQPLSKTQRKKAMHALQSLGEALVGLSADQLERLDLPEALHEAVVEASRIRSREARRRQLQYIGRLMRDVDAERIAEALARLRGSRMRPQSFTPLSAGAPGCSRMMPP